MRSEGEATPVADEDMGVDDFGDTQVRPTTIVTPIIQTTQLPPCADLPRDPDDVAWGALDGEADENTIIMQQLISMLQGNAMNMNPADVTAMRRTLEQSASNGTATSIAGLRILQPIFDKIPEDLVVCSGCGRGAIPGVQLCPRCHIAFSTIHSKVQRMVEGSMCSVMADATVCCIELGEGTVDSGQEEFVEEIER